MAHASRADALKIHMKKLRKQKAKERAKWRELSVEEQEEILAKRTERTLYDEVQLALWDYEHDQYATTKLTRLQKILKEAVDQDLNLNLSKAKTIIKRLE